VKISRDRRSLPDLGPRGEGWFLIQVAILGAVALAGGVGPAWFGPARVTGSVAGAALIGTGGLLAIRGVVDLGANLTVFPKPREHGRLVDTGAYRLVRHPIYGGLILGATGWGLATASPAALGGALVLAAFFDLKSRREEAWLSEQLEGYPAYRRRTRRLLPWLW
jgi:protein-S-isoprenylcysteine O-methyltransferase Ste14